MCMCEVDQEFYTTKNFAKIVGVSYKAVWSWVNKGKIQSVRAPSGRILIPRSELEKIKNGAYKNDQ